MRTYTVSLERNKESLSNFKINAFRLSEARILAQREKRLFAKMRGMHSGHLRAIVKALK